MVELRSRRTRGSDAAWHAIESQHATLRARAEWLEGQLGSLAAGNRRSGGEVHGWLDEFRRRLLEHLAYEEEKGLLDLAVAEEPRLARRFDRLRGQHRAFRMRMDALVEEARRPGWVSLHEGFVALRRDLLEHEKAENDLLHSAYLDDLGGRG